MSAALVLGTQAMNVFAQSSAPSAHAGRVAARKANHQLEHNVEKALENAKIDVADIRVVAKHGDVGLDGEVTNASDIETAATVAGKVPGVNSVKNYLTVYEEGAH
ncbi:BON domain-containing protein [Paraburkholderia sp.]|uniref:BON domain-containing protein n=1 Tax=Paraburkholderia sp. TaxID=1926495 RepID=UPI003C70F2C3